MYDKEYDKEHYHNYAYTLDKDIGANPSILGDITKIKLIHK